MILRARCILPIGEEAIDNGALVIKNGQIDWFGRWAVCEARGRLPVEDLGEVVLLPGLINAHCHLGFTAMAGKIPPPASFTDWVQAILAAKAHWTPADWAASWVQGAKMLAESGTTTVCDAENFSELLPELWDSTPLRIISFLEITGVQAQRRPGELIDEAIAHLERLQDHPRGQAALSPHALYSTTPELVRRAVQTSRARALPLSAHIAESEEEFAMFHDRGGPLFDWLSPQRPRGDCRAGSPVQLANQYGLLGPDLLAIHVNCLAPGDAELLARTRTAVVHCPRSHEYFNHRPFPHEELRRAGVNLCLGTDSLASTQTGISAPAADSPRLNLWDEMRAFASKHPGVRPLDIFRMVSTHPAKALGKENSLGQIQTGAAADLIALACSGRLAPARIYEALLFEPDLRAVFIAGAKTLPHRG